MINFARLVASFAGIAVALPVIAQAPAATTVTLAADETQALRSCVTAHVARYNPDDKRANAAAAVDSTWFAIALVRDLPGEDVIKEMPKQLSRLDLENLGAIHDNTAAYVAACATRFPASSRDYPITLPPPGFQLDAICTATASMLQGLYDESGFPELSATSETVMRKIGPRMSNAVFKRNGYDTRAKMTNLLGRSIVEAHRLGHMQSVLEACAAAG